MSPCVPGHFLLLELTAVLVSLMSVTVVVGQCSEAHRQTCSYSRLQLDSISARILPPDRYIPDFNETTLRQVCSLYNQFRECSQPFLSSCNFNVIHELRNLDNTFGLICGELFDGYLTYRVSCYQRLDASFQNCKTNQHKALETIDISSGTYRYQLCRTSKEYVMCIYSTTALGCSLKAADIYFKLLNQSIGSIFASAGLICDINHPMDVISIYTTTPSTTSTSLRPILSTDISTRTTKYSDRVSGVLSVHMNYTWIYRTGLFIVVWCSLRFCNSPYS